MSSCRGIQRARADSLKAQLSKKGGGSSAKTENVRIPNLQAHTAFLILGSLFGVFFLSLTPPFQIPDEPQHFYSAYLASELRFLSLVELNKDQRPLGNEVDRTGALLPSSLAYLVDGSEMVFVHKQEHRKIKFSRIGSLMTLPLYSSRREYLPVAPYPPVAYFPQALGIALGRLVGSPPLVLFYLARVFALAAWIALVYYAIKKSPLLKRTICLLALMPMTLFLAPSLSPDSLTSGVSFLLIAYLLYLAYDTKKSFVTKRDINVLLVLATILALCKAVYLLIVFLFFLIPVERLGGKKRYIFAFTSILTIGVAAYFLWDFLVRAVLVQGTTISLERHGVDTPPFTNVSQSAQIEFIFSHLGGMLDVLANTWLSLWFYLLNTFVGLLGWVDTWLPSWIPYVYIAALFMASFMDDSSTKVTVMGRILSIVIFVGATLISLLYIYIGWNAVGADMIQGFQGRYLIPVAPIFFLALGHSNSRFNSRRWISLVVIIVSTVVLSVTTYSVLERFYIETPLTYNIDQFEYSQEDFVFVRGWAIDRTSDSTATAVFVNIDGNLFQARYGDDRQDVATVMHKASYRYSGFEARIPTAEIGKGRHSISFKIITRNKESYEVPKRKVIFSIK